MTGEEQAQSICANIHYLRKLHCLSRTAMAHRIGIGIKTLDSFARGVIPPRSNVQILIDIYHTFGITPTTLMDTRLENENQEH